jgi:hypothetical protein
VKGWYALLGLRIPTDDRLAPVEGGWLLRSSEGFLTPYSRALNRPWSHIGWDWIGRAGLRGAVVIGVMIALFWVTRVIDLPVSVYVLVLLAGVLGCVLAVPFVERRLKARRVRRLLSRLAAVAVRAQVRDLPDGTLARVRGVIEAPRPFSSLVTGKPAVLARSLRLGGRGPFEVLHGIDFDLCIEAGERVHVSVRHAFLTDEPEGGQASCLNPTFADPDQVGYNAIMIAGGTYPPLYREVRVEPGDSIEVIGSVTRVVHPDADAAFGREPPMRVSMHGSKKVPLLVRRLG